MAKGQRKSNKEIRKPKKAADVKKGATGLAPLEPIKAALKKHGGTG